MNYHLGKTLFNARVANYKKLFHNFVCDVQQSFPFEKEFINNTNIFQINKNLLFADEVFTTIKIS